MERSCTDFVPHPYLLETLFAFKSKVSSIFRDVLGIYEIHHIYCARSQTEVFLN